MNLVNYMSMYSSVSIVPDYRLDDQVIRVRSPAEAKDFSCILCVLTSTEAHPTSLPIATEGPFLGVKHGHSTPSNAEVKNEELDLLSLLSLAWW
jgi:hypothetical protein